MATLAPVGRTEAVPASMARAPDSMRAMVWRRLRRDYAAMFGLVVMVLLIVVAVAAEQLAPYPFAQQRMQARFEGPSLTNWFGTDQFGRDELTRIMFGARVSLTVGLVSVGIALLIGI